MGSLFDYASRVPAVPPPQNNQQNEYHASAKAWSTQSKRVKNCASSIELLYKDITRLNLLLRFLKSPAKDVVLKARLFTTVDLDSKLSKLLWKFSSNTVIRCDFVHIGSLPPLSSKDKKELSRPSHPHQTPGLSLKNDVDDAEPEAESAQGDEDAMDIEEEEAAAEQKEPQLQIESNDNEKKDDVDADEDKVAPAQSAQSAQPSEPSIEASFVLGINEFYYLFLFLEDKLPELAAWLMQQSELNQSHVLLRALSAKLIDGDAAEHTVLDEEDDDDEEKKEPQQQQTQQQGVGGVMNEVDEDVCIICFEKMSNPVCLTCGHEYCKECIEDWQQQADSGDMGSGRQCPICRSLIEQSQMWVKLDSEEFSPSQYMCELLQFPFEYVSKFKPWTDAEANGSITASM